MDKIYDRLYDRIWLFLWEMADYTAAILEAIADVHDSHMYPPEKRATKW